MVISTKYESTVNTTEKAGRTISYIVLHYTAGVSAKAGTAAGVCRYWKTGRVQASADFVIDSEEICRYNPDIKNRFCWAVGGSRYNTKGGRLYGKAKNANCISIEMCSENANKAVENPCAAGWSIPTAVRDKAVELVRYLMDLYGVPAGNVIRHYDVNGKPCPGVQGWCEYGDSTNSNEWVRFREKISAEKEEADDMTEAQVKALIDKYGAEAVKGVIAEMAKEPESDWAADAMKWAKENGITDGSKPGAYCTREQVVTMIYRAMKGKEG